MFSMTPWLWPGLRLPGRGDFKDCVLIIRATGESFEASQCHDYFKQLGGLSFALALQRCSIVFPVYLRSSLIRGQPGEVQLDL